MDHAPMDERQYMAMAVEEMKKSVDEHRPDGKITPKVGAVLVCKDEKGLVFEDKAHRGELRNGDHAEFTLLERKNRGRCLTGGTIFATLEPCAAGARMSPKLSCAERIVNARVSTVYMGIEDPDPTVANKGKAYLEANGVSVRLFDRDFQDMIIRENKAFLEQARERAKHTSDSTILPPSDGEVLASLDELSQDALQFYANNQHIDISKDKTALYNHFVRIGLMTRKGSDYIPGKECIILFGVTPDERYHSVKIIIKAEHAATELETLKTLRGPMILMPQQAETWYNINAPEITNTDTMQRQSVKRLSVGIFREALVNAIVHRDYGTDASPISLFLSSTLIEVMSPGAPVTPLTVERLNTFNAPSLSRNPKITHVFSMMGYVEQAHHGMDVFRRIPQQTGFPLPHYQFDGTYLTLSFALGLQDISRILPGADQLSPEELRGFELIRHVRSINKTEFAKELGLSSKTAQRLLGSLKRKGFINDNGLAPQSKYFAYMIDKRFIE
ncbi:MAG: ATP-binding protein [Christensenellales bacterium]